MLILAAPVDKAGSASMRRRPFRKALVSLHHGWLVLGFVPAGASGEPSWFDPIAYESDPEASITSIKNPRVEMQCYRGGVNKRKRSKYPEIKGQRLLNRSPDDISRKTPSHTPTACVPFVKQPKVLTPVRQLTLLFVVYLTGQVDWVWNRLTYCESFQLFPSAHAKIYLVIFCILSMK